MQFQQISITEEIYNLGFGDFNEDLSEVDDLSVSNNQDTKKVLATVAQTVIDFAKEHPKAIIVARGSTASRTRLYQMGISQFWHEIERLFFVKGFRNNEWHLYEKGKNFEAFFIVKK